MADLKCQRCGVDPSEENEAYAYSEDRVGDLERTIWRCETPACGALAVVEGERVTWYYPDASEELALLRAERKAATTANAAWMAFNRNPDAQRAAQAEALQTAYAEAVEALDAYYAARPEARP